LVIWSASTGKPVCDKPLILEDAITAVAFAPIKGRLVIVAGLENGQICFVEFNDAENNGGSWRLLQRLDQDAAHHKAVRQLRFQPRLNQDQELGQLLLASCSLDHFVKLHSITNL
jgi:hypothetical protein